MKKDSKIFIAGHNGMVGSSILRLLKKEGYTNVITKDKKYLNLKDKNSVIEFFKNEKPEYVFLCAAKVGGINFNLKNPSEFLYDNLEIQNNVIHESYMSGVKKLCFLGSSCIYPKNSPQPIKEEYLLTGPLEPTNEGYSLAKIAGLKMCQYYKKQHNFNTISLMPCNLYGPNDSFDLEKSHVLSALVRKFVDACDQGLESITLWGTGVALREFIHVDDLSKICVYLMNNYNESEHINVGCGKEISIKNLAEIIANKTGFKGTINWDSSKPDGMLRKCLNVDKISELGILPKISINDGIENMINIYKNIKIIDDTFNEEYISQ